MFGCVRNLTCKLNFTFWAYRPFEFYSLYFRVCRQTPPGNRLWKWLSMILATGTPLPFDWPIQLTIAGENLWSWFFFSFLIKVHFPNWVRRNRLSMPTKSKLRRKRRRRPELNTRSPKRPFRGSWRTMRRWHLPPDTSKSSIELPVKSFFSPLVFVLHSVYLWCPIVNMILRLGLVKGHLWFVHVVGEFVALIAHVTFLLLNRGGVSCWPWQRHRFRIQLALALVTWAVIWDDTQQAVGPESKAVWSVCADISV